MSELPTEIWLQACSDCYDPNSDTTWSEHKIGGDDCPETRYIRANLYEAKMEMITALEQVVRQTDAERDALLAAIREHKASVPETGEYEYDRRLWSNLENNSNEN